MQTPEEKKLQTLLGFAQKAGKLVSGDFAVKAAFKERKVKLLFLAKDASCNSREKFLYLAEEAKIQVVDSLSGEELGCAIGKDHRVSVALTDEKFLKMLVVKNANGGMINGKTCV